jgi:hypothetical protein
LLTRASLFTGDAVLLHHAVEVVAIDAREARGFGHVVLCALEQVEHVALLEGVEGGGARSLKGMRSRASSLSSPVSGSAMVCVALRGSARVISSRDSVGAWRVCV